MDWKKRRKRLEIYNLSKRLSRQLVQRTREVQGKQRYANVHRQNNATLSSRVERTVIAKAGWPSQKTIRCNTVRATGHTSPLFSQVAIKPTRVVAEEGHQGQKRP